MTANELIKTLNLIPLPGEGGYYRETYRGQPLGLPPAHFGSPDSAIRPTSTAIYYLITPESFSALHRVKSDEIFHFYLGDTVDMIQIDSQGNLRRFILGTNLLENEEPQVLVQKGNWQALRLRSGGRWALMGTTVAPGFEFEDFELGERNTLLNLYPELNNDIMTFTRGDY